MAKVLITGDTRYPVNRKVIRKAVDATLKEFKMENTSFEVSVVVVGARKMKQISKNYLGDNINHQILTFVLSEESSPKILEKAEGDVSSEVQGFVKTPEDILRLGDIVLCWPQLVAEAGEDEMMVDDKIYELTAHGVEHLLGQHHE